MIVLTTRDILYKHDMHPIPANTFLEVEEVGKNRFKIVRGQYERVEIEKSSCVLYPLHFTPTDPIYTEAEYTAIHQELLQRREEVAELMQTVERNTELIEQLQKDAAETHRLRERNQSLLDQIEVMEGEFKPIALPREAVAEIEAIKAKCSENGDHWKFKVLKSIFDNHAPNLRRRTGVDQLLRALVNGYTVEESQTFQTNRKLDASEIRALRNWYKGALLRMEDGTDPDGFAKEAIEEVALYLGGAELLKDLSRFCKNQLERENAAQSG